MDYTTLIPSQNRNKPRFTATVDLLCNGVGAIAAAAQSMQTLFDIDTAAGEQLDFIGLWVGVSRRLDVPMTVFFSYDTDNLGWNEGEWRGPNQSSTQVTLLSDDDYRLLLKVMVRANHWDGTLVEYQNIMAAAFPSNSFWAVDNQDMTISVYVSGPPLSASQKAMLDAGGPLTTIKPAGVRLLALTELQFGFSEAQSSVGFGQGVFNS